MIAKSLIEKREKLDHLAEKEEEIQKVVMKSSPENGLDPQLEPMIAHYFLSVKEFRDEVDKEVSTHLTASTFSSKSDSSEVASEIAKLNSSIAKASIPQGTKDLLSVNLSNATTMLANGKKSKAIKLYHNAHKEFNQSLQLSLSLEEVKEEYRQIAALLLKFTNSVDCTTKERLSTLVDRNKVHLRLTLKALKDDNLAAAQENVSISEILLTTIEKRAYEK